MTLYIVRRLLQSVLVILVMTALVFVLRPAASTATAVTLPPGTALAGPERRFAAAGALPRYTPVPGF